MAISRRDFEEVWGAHDAEAIEDIYAADFRGHGYPFGMTASRGRYKRLVELFHGGFPDCSIEVEEMTADDEFVYAEWTFTGTHEGALGILPPSGSEVTFSGGGRHQHRDGDVSEVWLDVDWTTLYTQILRGYMR